MRIVFLLAISVMLIGCSTRYEHITSGAIGCAPNQITIYAVDSSHEGTSWTAVCQNRVYYCFQADGSMGGDFKCTPGK